MESDEHSLKGVMQIIARLLREMRLVSWAGCLALVLGGSSCLGPIKIQGSPAQLGVNGEPNLVIWAGDANGTKFHSIATPAKEVMGWEDRTVSFDWPSDLALSLPATIGSASVLLNPSPSAALRTCVHELLMEIERRNPDVITSVTVCVEPVGEVADGREFEAAVDRLAHAAIVRRANLAISPLLQYQWNPFQSLSWGGPDPTRIVLPNASAPGEYFLVRRQQSFDLLLLPLLDENPTEIQSVRADRVLADMADSEIVLFLEPLDTPYEVSESMRALMQQLTPQPQPGAYAIARMRQWPLLYSELTDAAAARLSLQGRLGSCSCAGCKAAARS